MSALAGCLVGSAVLTSCGATTFDATIVSTTQVTVVDTVPTGTTQELLLELSTAMNGLSVLIGPDMSGRTPSGKNEQIRLIESLWDVVEADVTSSDAEAADAIGRMVALARTAVDRNRPADADKAARFAGQVIGQFVSRT